MLKEREFRTVWVKTGHGIGVEIAAEIDEVIRYDGKEIIVNKTG